MPTAQPSVFVGTVDQDFQVERLGGPQDPFYYLVTRFPQQLYRQSPDTVLYKYLRVLLGETGVNSLKKEYLKARLLIEENGIDLFDLDSFYGNPLKFGRILEESLSDAPTSLISPEDWQLIQSKNARYRNRAQDFVSGARAGNTPEGIRLVAKSGLGHDVEVVENYKFLYDCHSDDPLRLDYLGRTASTEEFIIMPRPEVGTLETQRISVYGTPNPPNFGFFNLVFNGQSTADHTYEYDSVTHTGIPVDGTADHVRLALEALPQIGPGNVKVTGGSGPQTPWEVTFIGKLANSDAPQLLPINNLAYFEGFTPVPSNLIDIKVTTVQGGEEATDNVVSIPDRARHTLQEALDRTRPQTSIPTLGAARGVHGRVRWQSASASSEYSEVVRYVTGTSNITWPTPSETAWIQPDIENVGPRAIDDLQYHYAGFHDITGVAASQEEEGFEATSSTAAYPEPLFVTSSVEDTPLLNGIYPLGYQSLVGAPGIVTRNGWWSSGFGSDDEVLELNLGQTEAVNYLSFEIISKPLTINIEYDLLDDPDDRQYVAVTPLSPYNNRLADDATAQNVWTSVGLSFSNSKQNMIFTRRLRLTFTREQSYQGTVLVRNLRAARNVS